MDGKKPASLMLVPMIDIFTVLVTFLLMTAVFSRLTIMQLELPSNNSVTAGPPPEFRLEVIVRKDGLEMTNGTDPIATIPKVNGEYDFNKLTELAVTLKKQYPKANDASVLLEKDIAYDFLIQGMDSIRSAYVPVESDPLTATASESTIPASDVKSVGKLAQPRLTKMALFSNIAVGEAP